MRIKNTRRIKTVRKCLGLLVARKSLKCFFFFFFFFFIEHKTFQTKDTHRRKKLEPVNLPLFQLLKGNDNSFVKLLYLWSIKSVQTQLAIPRPVLKQIFPNRLNVATVYLKTASISSKLDSILIFR